ncbi:MAG: branched-chain amino acid transaminase [Acidobacteriota bacterium]|nr:MAG: branched-chain amino acid transaminase [Acidobacteriota bacterium]
MGFEKTKWVWHNGRQVRWNEAMIHSSAYGLHYGTGVFEGIRSYETPEGPAVFRMQEHLERLSASAAVYDLKIPYTREQLEEAICENLRLNGLESCYIRPIVYFDSESLGIRAICPVSVTILAWEWADVSGKGKKEEGLRVTVSPWKKFHSSMMPTTAKSTGQYLNSILAVREAASRGFDEAILLDINGNLAEGAVENLFLVRDGKVYTNDESSSILLGITRDSVIRIAGSMGYEVVIGTMRLEDLLSADEAFLTGTAMEIAPIREVDGRAIGRRGPVTEKLQRAFFEIVSGRNPDFEHWLHPVNTAVFRSAAPAGAAIGK